MFDQAFRYQRDFGFFFQKGKLIRIIFLFYDFSRPFLLV